MAEHVEMQILHIKEPLIRVESIPPKFDFKKWREHKKDTEVFSKQDSIFFITQQFYLFL